MNLKTDLVLHSCCFCLFIRFCLGWFCLHVTNIRGLGFSEGECLGEEGFTSIFIAIDFVLIS